MTTYQDLIELTKCAENPSGEQLIDTFHKGPLHEIPFTVFGHYNNSCMVERSNLVALKNLLVDKDENFPAGVFHVTGNYGYECLAFNELISEESAEIIGDFLENVYVYTCYDTELESKMTFDAIMAGFDNDWFSELTIYTDPITNDIPPEVMDKAREVVTEGMGDIAMVEAGGNVYIDWDAVSELLTEHFPVEADEEPFMGDEPEGYAEN